MKTSIRHLSLLLLILLVAACGKEQLGQAVHLGETFDLKLGESVYLPEGTTKVYFSQLVEEKRCPGLDCLEKGAARIKVVLQEDGGEIQTLDLVSSDFDQNAQSVIYKKYVFSLVNVWPYPKNNTPIPADEYTIELRIDSLIEVI